MLWGIFSWAYVLSRSVEEVGYIIGTGVTRQGATKMSGMFHLSILGPRLMNLPLFVRAMHVVLCSVVRLTKVGCKS